MKLTRLEIIPIEAPLKRLFQGSYYSMDRRATLITRLYTDEGLVSEVYNGDEVHTQREIAKIMAEEIWPLIEGMDPRQIHAVREAMHPLTMDILRDRGLVIMAMAAIDTALWDIVGKAAQMPLVNLWGGYRSRLPLIAIGGYYSDDLADLEKEVADYRELGIEGVKMKVGSADPATDAHRFRVMREAAGDDFLIMADANQGYTVDEAVRFAHLVADLDMTWFEEPVGWRNDRAWMRDVRYKTGVAVAAGQSEHSLSAARTLMTDQAIDVCNFDASWSGGPTEWLAVAATALSFGLKMGHHEEPQISGHLLASQPHGTYMECFHPDRDPVFWEMLVKPKLNGTGYQLPSLPGFGIELDSDWVEAHRLDR